MEGGRADKSHVICVLLSFSVMSDVGSEYQLDPERMQDH